MNIKLLRGRVVIREDLGADHAHLKHIVVPQAVLDDHPTAEARRRTWHRGTVLAMGAPARTKRRKCRECAGTGRVDVPCDPDPSLVYDKCFRCGGSGGLGGVEVPYGFDVGDTVLFHWVHLEKGWTVEWVDGEAAAVVPQECVDAVVG